MEIDSRRTCRRASPLCLLVVVEIREEKNFRRTRESIMKKQGTFISILFTYNTSWIFLRVIVKAYSCMVILSCGVINEIILIYKKRD